MKIMPDSGAFPRRGDAPERGGKDSEVNNLNVDAVAFRTAPLSGLLRVRFFEATVHWEKRLNRSSNEEPRNLKRLARMAFSNYGIKPQDPEDFLYLIHVDIRNANIQGDGSR